ncbi:NAD(P)-binding domain-containing protein [Glycomyces xiaoerkulensis]|uniref:NAD(P)-binding domain-containing protein n=1 Tax=Glycomyces xiaoerkulensis TaxID=2038139 RepID=UPI000C26136F|nr:NAD(P)-binding domain-containing protein [Glycomyces xiaoerkulensis]
MTRIGIIGVGEIGRSIVIGLCEGTEGPPPVFLSPRGARTAAALSEAYEGVQVCTDNQAVVDRSDIVVIAVRPHDQSEALDGLRVDPRKVAVNVMAGVRNDDLRRRLATEAAIVRAIPLPAVRERRSITVTCPAHPDVDALFDRLGGSLAVPRESELSVFSALTATLSTHYRYLHTLVSWAADQGIPAADAERYVRGLFQGIGRALGDETASLEQLAAGHETPNGINERIRTTWFDPPNVRALTRALDDLLASFAPRRLRRRP